jgi:acetyl esterase/lipase
MIHPNIRHMILLIAGMVPAMQADTANAENIHLLWPDTPGLNSSDGLGNEAQKRGKTMLTGVQTPHLRLYEAPVSPSPSPAVLLVPGGGYNQLVTSIHEPIAAWLQEQGIRPFLLAYRCPSDRKNPKGPEQDIQRAMRILRAHAQAWNIDPRRIGVLGSSAGGNLAVRASVSSRINTYPPTDATDRLDAMPDFSILLYPAWVGHRGTGGLSQWVEVRPEYGPTFITAARDDKHFGSSPPYGAALREAGVPVKELYFDQGGHGFTLREPPGISTWPEACLAFLKQMDMVP